MSLILRIQSYRKQAPATPVERRFDHLGGSIGRSAGNDLELPDPGKYISRNHGKIDFAGGRYTLMDLGSNPSWINDKPVGTGKTAPLEHGDRLLIGDYVLEVIVDEAHAAAAAAVPVFAPETSAALPFQAQPARAPAPESGPAFADLQDTLASAPILAVGAFDARTRQFAAAPGGDDPLGLNLLEPKADDSLDFRGSEADHVAPQFMPMPAARLPDAPAPPLQSAAPAWTGPGAPVAAPAWPAPAAAKAGGAMLIPDDYDPLADFLPPRLAAPAPVPYAPLPAHSAPAYAAPAPHVPPAPPAYPPPSPAPGADDGAVLQALLRGLGIPGVQPARPPAETAELVGAMLREATAGTMAVLLARAMTKRESRLDMTVLGAQANNPLKFFPDAEGALAQLLTNAMAGYMPPLKSFGSAFDDLKAHEMAVIAGMRAALAGVLQRFNPALIEARLEPAGVMDKMLSTSRKAKMWDRLVELYGDIEREANDDFQHLFGERFSEAYEDQIGRLRQVPGQ